MCAPRGRLLVPSPPGSCQCCSQPLLQGLYAHASTTCLNLSPPEWIFFACHTGLSHFPIPQIFCGKPGEKNWELWLICKVLGGILGEICFCCATSKPKDKISLNRQVLGISRTCKLFFYLNYVEQSENALFVVETAHWNNDWCWDTKSFIHGNRAGLSK